MTDRYYYDINKESRDTQARKSAPMFEDLLGVPGRSHKERVAHWENNQEKSRVSRAKSDGIVAQWRERFAREVKEAAFQAENSIDSAVPETHGAVQAKEEIKGISSQNIEALELGLSYFKPQNVDLG